MLTWVREKFGTVVIGLIIGFIGFVFVFSGVFSPKATRGLHEGAVAGLVNGEAITIGEFNRSLQQRLEMFKQMGGGSIQFTDEQLRALGIRRGVFDGLVQRKLLIQEAARQKILASDAEVRDEIRKIPAFQKDGKFDYLSYKSVLEANQYTVSGFERLIREDLSAQRWNDFFRSRVKVSDQEIEQEFLMSEKKRMLKYVVLTPETGRKAIDIPQKEIDAYLSNPENLNLVKSRYEALKDTVHQGKSFDIAKQLIAKDLLAGEKQSEILQANEKLAARILPIMAKSKESDSRVNSALKSVDEKVQASGWITAGEQSLPGIADASAILADAFSDDSPIDGKPKLYHIGPRLVVALVTDKKEPDQARLESQRQELTERVVAKKQQELFGSWMKKLMDQAKIEINQAVVGDT